MMKLPYPHFMDKTPVVINITQGISESGAPLVTVTYTGKCTFSEKTKTVYKPDGKTVELLARLSIGCDIAPTVPTLEGKVIVNSIEYIIYKGARKRNPDGSVHHTELELM